MDDQYLTKIKRVIELKTGTSPEEITESSLIRGDLNIGEMELIDILTELEEELKVDLIENKDNFETLQDILDLLVEEIE